MRLAIITTTFRDQPHFEKMARHIAASLRFARDQGREVSAVWLVVDEVLWYEERADDRRAQLAAALERLGGRAFANGDSFLVPLVGSPDDDGIRPFDALHVVHRAPKHSVYRGPGRDPKITSVDLPDSNSPRQSALAIAGETDYTLFLDDCCLPVRHLMTAVCAAEEQGAALRYKFVNGLRHPPLEADGIVRSPVGPLRFTACEAAAMKGNTGGYPTALLWKLQGFDERYAGSYGYVEIDVAIRASRLGCKFLTTEWATVFELAEGHVPQSSSGAAMSGKINRRKFNELKRDKKRTLPIGPQATLEDLRDDELARLQRSLADGGDVGGHRPAPTRPPRPEPGAAADASEPAPEGDLQPPDETAGAPGDRPGDGARGGEVAEPVEAEGAPAASPEGGEPAPAEETEPEAAPAEGSEAADEIAAAAVSESPAEGPAPDPEAEPGDQVVEEAAAESPPPAEPEDQVIEEAPPKPKRRRKK